MNKVIMKKVYIFLFGLILSACSYSQVNHQELTLPTTSNTIKQSSTSKPILEKTILPTSTQSIIPTITKTFTPTLSPTAIWKNKELLLINGYDTDAQDFYCGVIDIDGKLYKKRITDVKGISQDFFCARGFNTYAVWSNDVQFYAYRKWFMNDLNSIFVGSPINNNYHGETNIAGDYYFYWLPDNSGLILYGRKTADVSIDYLVDSRETISIGSYPPSNNQLYRNQLIRPSPDSKYILLESNKLGTPNVFLHNLLNHKELILTERINPTKINNIVWSPDGQLIAIDLVEKWKEQIYLFDKNGEVISTLENSKQPIFSRDGSQLAFICDSQRICLYRRGDLTIRKLVGIEFPVMFTWSPDGKYIAWTSKSKLSVYSLSDSSNISIVPLTTNSPSISWSSSGEWILVENLGPKIPESGLEIIKTIVICNIEGGCRNLNADNFYVFDGIWWQPAGDWEVNEIYPESVWSNSEAVYTDNFDGDNNNWLKSGSINQVITNISILQIKSGEFVSNTPISKGNAAGARIKFDSTTSLKCGIQDSSQKYQIYLNIDGSLPASKGYFNYHIKEGEEDFQPGLFSHSSGLFANQWNDIYFRIRENNQIEAAVMNSDTGRRLSSYVEVRDVEWFDKDYFFFCEEINGSLWIDFYKEYSFSTP